MMKYIFSLLTVFLVSTTIQAQRGYDTYSKTDGLEISTKWGKARDADGARRPALLLRIENHNDFAVSFGFDVNFYYEGILRETGGVDRECIDGLKSRIGKLNGVYFIPEKFTPEQLKSGDFHYSIDDVSVEKNPPCPDGDIAPDEDGGEN